MKTVYGIADAHGIESFTEDKSKAYTFFLRASLNRQRHAVAYEARLTNGTYESIKKLLAERKFKGALIKLKYGSNVLKVARGQENSVALIPDSSLDPYGGGYDD